MTRPLALALILAVLAVPASAEQFCDTRAAVVEKLSLTYGEAPRGMGLQGKEGMLEVWTSESTGSWSVVMTYTDGDACVVAVGANWVDLPITVGDPT